jgi:serine/threonine-protein phosphatase 2B regulatory subunit
MGVEASASASYEFHETKKSKNKKAKGTHFTEAQIEQLRKKYIQIGRSRDKNGNIDIAEFQRAIGVRNPEFAKQIFRAFDIDRGKNITFEEFVAGLSAVSPKATVEEKAKFCFKIYDIDGSGTIDKEELRKIILLSAREKQNISQQEAERTAQDLFRKFDQSHDGKISLQEFTTKAKTFPQILSFIAFTDFYR